MVVYANKPDQQYDKIGGLLIVVGFALISTAVKVLVFLTNDLLPLFSGESWKNFTTSDSDLFHPWYGRLLIFELIGNLILLLSSIVLIVLFFQKYKYFPKLMIGLIIFSVLFSTIDYFAGKFILSVANQYDAKYVYRTFGSVIVSILWILYLLNSERVRRTFIKDKLNL